MKVGQIVERAQQISEIGKRRKLKSYYFTHVDVRIAHTHIFTQTQPDSKAFNWLSQMGFFFLLILFKLLENFSYLPYSKVVKKIPLNLC